MSPASNSVVILLTIGAILAAVALDFLWIRLRRRWAGRKSESGAASARRFSIAMVAEVGRRALGRIDWRAASGAAVSRLRPLLFALILVLAAFPSVCVVLDRWFGVAGIGTIFSKSWRALPALSGMPLPSYFLAAFIGLPVAGLLVCLFPPCREAFRSLQLAHAGGEGGIPDGQLRAGRILRRFSLAGFVAVIGLSVAERRTPGWELALAAGAYVAGWFLRGVSLEDIRRKVRENQGWLFSCILVHAALVASIAAFYSAPAYLPVCLAGLALAAFDLYRHRRGVPAVFWIFTLGLVLFSININAWWLAVAGDEYGFYINARWILEKAGTYVVAGRVFDELGVYGQNPFLASIVQAAFLRVFGVQSFGWRFSNVYLCAASIPFFYLFFREFIARRAALAACFFIAVSHYWINYSKIGYVSLQSVFALSLTLAAAAWAVRSRSAAAFAAAGAALAMNFYSFGIAVVSIPLALLLLLFYVPPTSRPAGKLWAVLAGSFGMLCFPLFFQPEYWRTSLNLTVYSRAGEILSSENALQLILNRIATSTFSYLYAPNESHFVAVGFLDAVSACLAGIGFLVVLFRSRHNRFAFFFLAGFGILLSVAGIFGSTNVPSVTRMFVLIPWWAAAAAFGLEWVAGRLPSGGSRAGRIQNLLFAGILGLAAAANLCQATRVAYDRWVDREPFESRFLQLAGRVSSASSAAPSKYVFLVYEKWSMDPFLRFQDLYPRSFQGVALEKIGVEGAALPEAAVALASDPGTVFVVLPTLNAEWRAGLQADLEGLGAERCSLYTPKGKWEFDLFYFPDLAGICPGRD
jgi:hypothetical protein